MSTRRARHSTNRWPRFTPNVAKGALEDAGLSKDDIDGYFCAGDAPASADVHDRLHGPQAAPYRYSTETGGSSYLVHVGTRRPGHRPGKCNVALITLAGKPRTEGHGCRHRALRRPAERRTRPFEVSYGPAIDQHVRHVCHAPHVRVRHHQRTARLDQGRRLASRPVQPACAAASDV
jgi:hypothetical protein